MRWWIWGMQQLIIQNKFEFDAPLVKQKVIIAFSCLIKISQSGLKQSLYS